MKFNYNTLDVTIHPQTRSLTIALNRPEKQNQMNLEMLFELEGLFGWLTAHLEINAVVLTGRGPFFCSGLDREELKMMSEEKLRKYLIRFQKLISGMLCLPQTFICDIRKQSNTMGLELSLGADIRIAHEMATFHFDALQRGWVPCAGGIGLLGLLVGHATARHWTLTTKEIKAQEAKKKGLLAETYEEEESKLLNNLLEKIMAQSPVARIQGKRSLLEAIMPELTRSFEFEPLFSFASLKTNDWKKDPKKSEENFMSARELSLQSSKE